MEGFQTVVIIDDEEQIKQREIDRIVHLYYTNLRKCMDTNLIEPILGKDYYNYGSDVYSCDKFVTDDLKYEFNKLKEIRNIITVLLIISVLINIIGAIVIFR